MMTTHAKPPKIALASKPSLIKLAQDIDFFELFKRIEAKHVGYASGIFTQTYLKPPSRLPARLYIKSA